MLRRLESLLMFRMSVSVRGVWAMPPPCFEERRMILFAISWVLLESDTCTFDEQYEARENSREPSLAHSAA